MVGASLSGLLPACIGKAAGELVLYSIPDPLVLCACVISWEKAQYI